MLFNLTNKLITHSDEKLLIDFECIPNSTTILNLTNNNLGNRDTQLLIKCFSRIPNNVTKLILAVNVLYLKDYNELKDIYTALPISLLELDLTLNNNVPTLGENQTLALAFLPANIKKLNLTYNLKHLEICGLKRAFLAIPPTISTLYLKDEDNSLARILPDELRDLANTLPFITALSISNNTIAALSPTQLDAFASIAPNTLTTLVYEKNGMLTTSGNVHALKALEHSKRKALVPTAISLQQVFKKKRLPEDIAKFIMPSFLSRNSTALKKYIETPTLRNIALASDLNRLFTVYQLPAINTAIATKVNYELLLRRIAASGNFTYLTIFFDNISASQADINWPSPTSGKTALHHLIINATQNPNILNDYQACYTLLIAKGALLNITDFEGKKPDEYDIDQQLTGAMSQLKI